MQITTVRALVLRQLRAVHAARRAENVPAGATRNDRRRPATRLAGWLRAAIRQCLGRFARRRDLRSSSHRAAQNPHGFRLRL